MQNTCSSDSLMFQLLLFCAGSDIAWKKESLLLLLPPAGRSRRAAVAIFPFLPPTPETRSLQVSPSFP